MGFFKTPREKKEILTEEIRSLKEELNRIYADVSRHARELKALGVPALKDTPPELRDAMKKSLLEVGSLASKIKKKEKKLSSLS